MICTTVFSTCFGKKNLALNGYYFFSVRYEFLFYSTIIDLKRYRQKH